MMYFKENRALDLKCCQVFSSIQQLQKEAVQTGVCKHDGHFGYQMRKRQTLFCV